MAELCRMILDVDTGVDDAMAILYALNRPGIQLEALTTTFGNTDVDTATAEHVPHSRTRRAKRHSGRARLRPLAAEPFVKGAEHVHGRNGLGDVVLPEPKAQGRRGTRERSDDPLWRAKIPARSRSVLSGRSPMWRSLSPRRPTSRRSSRRSS